MLAGVVVTTQLGISATVFYLAIYVVMNLGAFAVIVARERETGLGDDISSLYGLGANRPWLAWPMTISMLALAGFPATAGFFGKIYLIEAAVDNGYAWLGVVIVLGSAVSLAYYLRVVAAVWMRAPSEAPAALVRAAARPVIAGGSAEADDEARAAGRTPGADSATVVDIDGPAPPARAAPAGGRVRRGRLRAGHDRLRRLPRAAVRRRQGRRRGDSHAATRPRAAAPVRGAKLSRGPPMRVVRSRPTAGQAIPRVRRRRRPRGGGAARRRAGGGSPRHRRARSSPAVKHGICLVGRRHLHVAATPRGRASRRARCRSDTTGGEGSVTAFSVEIGGKWTLTVTPQSDGTVAVVRTAGGSAGVTGGLGAGVHARAGAVRARAPARRRASGSRPRAAGRSPTRRLRSASSSTPSATLRRRPVSAELAVGREGRASSRRRRGSRWARPTATATASTPSASRSRCSSAIGSRADPRRPAHHLHADRARRPGADDPVAAVDRPRPRRVDRRVHARPRRPARDRLPPRRPERGGQRGHRDRRPARPARPGEPRDRPSAVRIARALAGASAAAASRPSWTGSPPTASSSAPSPPSTTTRAGASGCGQRRAGSSALGGASGSTVHRRLVAATRPARRGSSGARAASTARRQAARWSATSHVQSSTRWPSGSST